MTLIDENDQSRSIALKLLKTLMMDVGFLMSYEEKIKIIRGELAKIQNDTIKNRVLVLIEQVITNYNNTEAWNLSLTNK